MNEIVETVVTQSQIEQAKVIESVEVNKTVKVNYETAGKQVVIKSLKVAADPQDITHEEKKRRAKKLAGAISHALRINGEIDVRAFGDAAISKGAKSLAIAKSYLDSDTKKLQLSFSPAFINADTGTDNKKMTGICYYTFATEKQGDLNLDDVKSVLKVKADPEDASKEQRIENMNKLAGAIANAIEEHKECLVRCIGHAAIGKAARALAKARGFTASKGPDLYAWSDFISAEMNGQEKTGIVFYVFSNN